MATLWGWLSVPRYIFFWIDVILFSLVDNVYDLFIKFANYEVISPDAFDSLTSSIYILVSIIAFFRLAMLLVNSIIDPEKLYEKKRGLGSLFGRVCLMIALIVLLPILFKIPREVQKEILDSNIIYKIILNDQSEDMKKNGVTKAGKTFQKIIATSLIKPEELYFEDGSSGVDDYLNADNPDIKDYVNNDCSSKCEKAMETYHNIIKNSNGTIKLRFLQEYIAASREIDANGDGDKEDVYFLEYIAILTSISLGFLIYVILSWTIDIAVRSVEISVLQLICPLFVATIVDPKSTEKGGYFNNWLTRYGKTYADLFLKMIIIAFSILMISIVQDGDIFKNLS